MEVPTASVEIPLPPGILSSLPNLDEQGVAPGPELEPLPGARRANDGLVREVTVPINLSLEELEQYRRSRLRITLDVTIVR